MDSKDELIRQQLQFLIRYGDHTKTCATRDYHENQHGGFHSYMGKSCNCGWESLRSMSASALERTT